jgi:hypothetical protein
MTIPTPDSVYEQVWKGIVEKDGAPDFQKVKELLFDYGALLAETQFLYKYLTEGQIDDPQEPVEDVIDLADHLAAESIDLGIRSVLSHLLEELDRTSANSPEERLQTLTATINSIYEQGAPDAE